MKRRLEPTVFFPWERRRGVMSRLRRARLQWVLALAVVLFLLWHVRGRMDRIASERATRARIWDTVAAVRAYRADHKGECPRSLEDLRAAKLLAHRGTDAWGRPLRIVCPGRRDTAGFDVLSDGPDGIPYGLDRIE
jgi:general secretion pathway protein G